MNWRYLATAIAVAALVALAMPRSELLAADQAPAAIKVQLQIKAGHPWRPPFGLDRVGQPLEAVVTLPQHRPPEARFVLVGYRDGKEVSRQRLLPNDKSQIVRISLQQRPTEVAVLAQSKPSDEFVELMRHGTNCPTFEAEAVARADRLINPVDLGTILVPADWLLLAGGQKAIVDVAAINDGHDLSAVQVVAWYASAPQKKATADVPLVRWRKANATLTLGPCSQTLRRDVLHVTIKAADGKSLWQKQIPVMIVPDPPKLPTFGAFETKLRYDAPISVRTADGKFTSMDYATAWDSKLKDVVVALPNGSRFVFWRGSSYIPFWAGRHNTGFCYEWAESLPPADATDAVEPLMDKELRYGRVKLIESTPARIHVRWSYQSCDFNYKTWGDSAVEDFYFYPDGFGTRVLTLQADPKANYELNELIVLTPQSTYPVSVLPSNLVDILYVDGQTRQLTFPFHASDQREKIKPRNMPALYRVRFHQSEPTAAIYFSPLERNLPESIYGHFVDADQIVTPVYWGSHWPLARGNTTGGAINDRIAFTPCHNSIMTWGFSRRPEPLHATDGQMRDTLGRSKPMRVQTWAWLIGTSDAKDDGLLQWARSYSTSPSLEVRGGRLNTESYVPERRAIRLIVEDKALTVVLKPTVPCVNPVFELADAPPTLVRVSLAGQPLDAKQYAWDGKTLWIGATIAEAATLQLDFAK
jgi:hypothetical protein